MENTVTTLTPHTDTTARGFALTDHGNGERIAALFGDDLRHCVETRQWLLWDGRRWCVDSAYGDRICRLALMAARELYAADPSAARWARASESLPRLRAAIGAAAAIDSLRVPVAALDRDDFLLNCENGVVDLRSGALLPHDRLRLQTKICNGVTYSASAECPIFLDALERAMGRDDSRIGPARAARRVAFLQRVFGYALTGDVREGVAFEFFGAQGDEGKSTFLGAFHRVMGSYAETIPPGLLGLTSGYAREALLYFADFRAARFITVGESDRPVNGSMLRYAVGRQGFIQGKHKYASLVEFPPTHKLFFEVNRRTRIRGLKSDDGLLKTIPFDVFFRGENRDAHLSEKLSKERAGILTWAVQGCLAWQRDGLGPEDHGAAAIARSRDSFAAFLQERCEAKVGAWTRTSELYPAYLAFCTAERFSRPCHGRSTFCAAVRAAGYRLSRSRRDDNNIQIRTWEGLGLA